MALDLIKCFQTHKEDEQVSKRDIRFFFYSSETVVQVINSLDYIMKVAKIQSSPNLLISLQH